MQPDRLQLQRQELKYVVTESIALAARDFVRSYLVLDENGRGKPDNSYPVHSIYVDSPDLALCQQTLSGEKNRFKLRMRFYDDAADSPIFLEIKRRVNNAILKQRCPVSRQSIPAIVEGRVPPHAEVLSRNPKHLAALERFVFHLAELQAAPKGQVAYVREAWISPHDDSVRVTMDRRVRFDAERCPRISTQLKNPVSVFGDKVILEMKFTARFPTWFGEFVRVFGLVQGSAAKYADGIVAYGEPRLKSFPRAEQGLQKIA